MADALGPASNSTLGSGDTFIAQINEDGDIVLVNRHQVLERIWASMGVSEGSDAVEDLKKARVEGEAARRPSMLIY